MQKLKTCVIWLWKQWLEYHIPALIECDYAELNCICDIDGEKVKEVSEKYWIIWFTNIDQMLNDRKIDLAIVSVPHSDYFKIISLLASKWINILKEKPLAMDMIEAVKICELVKDNNIQMMITLQRRHNPIYMSFHQLKKRIWKIYMIEWKYTMNIGRLDLWWRSSMNLSWWWATIDMWYHMIDLLVWYFWLPNLVNAQLSWQNREDQMYNVEDTVNFWFQYWWNEEFNSKIIWNITISRVYPKKQETLSIYWSKGIIEINRWEIRRLDIDWNQVECLTREWAWPSAAIEQIDSFALQIMWKENKSTNYIDHLKHIAIVDSIYKSNREWNSVNPIDLIPSKYLPLN